MTNVELILFSIMLILMAGYLKEDRAFNAIYQRIRHILLVSVRFIVRPFKERIVAAKRARQVRKALEELDLQEPGEQGTGL